MGLLKRIFGIGKSKANAMLDKIEDPIELLNQKVVDLKEMLSKSMEGLARIKAVQIGLESEATKLKSQAQSFRDKAVKLKKMMDSGVIGKSTAKIDITTMLNKHENLLNEANKKDEAAKKQSLIVQDLQSKIIKLKDTIKSTEEKVQTSKGEMIASKANKEITKELSSLNLDGVNSELEELSKKINSNNAEASAWQSLEDSTMSDEDRINKLLSESSTTDDDKLFSDFINEGK